MLTVITGPPCSGKSTYLREHARPGDVTIDLDVIAQALGSPVTHDHDHAHRKIAIAARSGAIAEAIGWARRAVPVWVIDSRPAKFRLAQYAQADAGFVHLDATAEELHRRAAACRPPRWHDLIDEWFARSNHDA